MHRLDVAIENYDDKGGFMSQSFPKWTLKKAGARLADPAGFQTMFSQQMTWVAIHELGHACGIPGHLLDGGPEEGDGGEPRCFMRYTTTDEDKRNLVLQTLLHPGDSLLVGIDQFCKDGFNCRGHMDVHDR